MATGKWFRKNPGFEEEADDKPKMWFANSLGYTYRLLSDNPYEGARSLLVENKGQSFSGALYDAFPEVGEVINKELGSGSPQWKRVNSLRRFGYGEEGTIAKLEIMRMVKSYKWKQ